MSENRQYVTAVYSGRNLAQPRGIPPPPINNLFLFYLMKNKLKLTSRKKSPLQKKEEKKRSRPKISLTDIYKSCKKETSLNNITKQFGISTHSAAIYIERLLRKGYDINIDLYIHHEKRIDIEEAFLALQTSSIKRVAENLQGKATEEEIRIVRGYLQGKQVSEL